MKVSSAALALLLTGTTTAFVPTLFHISKSVNHVHSSTLFAHVNRPKFPTPKVTSDTPISTDSQYLKNIMEARYCLLEIETAAEKAREYLEYMEEVSQVIRQFLGGNAPSIQLPENVQDAHEYLNNIEKATANALEYLQYLEDMAVDIKGYLQTFQQEYEKGAGQEHFQKAQEAKAYFDSLEETAASARDYLTSLQEVATVVEGYLEKLKIAQMPQLLSAEEARATRVLQPNELPFPPLEQVVDPNMTTPPTKRVEPVTVAKPPPPPATSSGSYLDSIASMDSIAAARPSGSGPRSYLDTMARPSSTTTGGSGGPRGYLDNISNATPTSHFKESADSTPFAQAGPPEKGRSDVSHMDTYDLQTPAVVEDVGPTSVDWAKAPPPTTTTTAAAAPPAATTTKSYLDQMSSSSASSKPAAATTGSYLDQMSKSSSSKRAPVGKKAGPTSYLDSMTRGSGRPTKKAVPKKGPTSYLDTMSAAGATSSKRGPTSYLDQVSKTPATPIDWSQAKATTGSMPPPAATTTTMRPQGSMPPPAAAAAAAAARRAPTVGGGGGSMPRPASRAATQSVSQKPRATSPYGNRMTPPKPTKKLVIDWAQAKARQAANSKAASSSAPRPTAGRGMAVKPDPLHSSKGPVQANPRAHSQQRPTRRIAAWPKGTRPSRRVAAAAPPQKPMATQAGPRPTRTMIRPQKPAAPTLPIRPDANVRATRRTTSPARPTRRMPIRPSRPVPKRATKLTGAAASYLESMSAPPPAAAAAAAAATTRRSPPKQQKAPGSTLPRSPYQPNPNAADSSRRPAKQQEGNGKKARPNFEWMF